MRHPLPWAWLANILPGDRWRPFRRLDAAWNRSGYLQPINEAKQHTKKWNNKHVSFLILHLHMPLMQPCNLRFFSKDDHIDWNLPSCVFTNLFLCHWVWRASREAWPWPEGVKTPQPPRRPVIHVPWCWLRGGNSRGFEDQGSNYSLLIMFVVLGGIICHIFLPVLGLGAVIDLPTLISLLPASIVSTCTQVAVRQALRWAQKADGRWLTEMHVLIIAYCYTSLLSCDVATNHEKFWNKWTCFCFAAFDLEAACHDVEGNLFATVYISTDELGSKLKTWQFQWRLSCVQRWGTWPLKKK